MEFSHCKKLTSLFTNARCISNLPNRSYKPIRYWNEKENIIQFLSKLGEKFALKTPEHWNNLTARQIQSSGGSSLLTQKSMYEIKCLACPEGEHLFQKPIPSKPPEYWNDPQNIKQFLNEFSKTNHIKSTPEDWNLITYKQIKSFGGSGLLRKYSMYEIKCLACPEGKHLFQKPIPSKPSGYWNKKENILQFLSDIKIKYNLQIPEDWNSITKKIILSNGGNLLLRQYSMYEIKCLACPEGKHLFHKPTPSKPSGFWNDRQNINHFLEKLKEKYNLQSPEDWNSITYNQIKSQGVGSLLNKYSIYELKCMGCPEGEAVFDKPIHHNPPGFWDLEENRLAFFEKLKIHYNLHTPEDWQRLSKYQIISQGGIGLLNSKYVEQSKLTFQVRSGETVSYSLHELLHSKSILRDQNKRASQRWLFLQIQKLFPQEEIVEDYFHSEISRATGYSVQFDIFLTKRNIAIEYHGEHHYEDIPSGFGPLEMYNNLDQEKQKLCTQHGIQLIIVPYWWDNKLDSLKETLHSIINSSSSTLN